MRFSSFFKLPAVPPPAARVREPLPVEKPAEATPVQPDDLDERVRLVGEWQLGEGL